MNRKILSLIFTLVLMVCFASCAQAKPDEILAKNLENTLTHESDTLKINIDQWHYEYKKHDLRFFVAHIYVNDPAQLQTAFANEQYNKTFVEATSDIAARHDAVLAVNGDYYNYKDDTGLIIRNGVLYRDKKGSRDYLLIKADGSFETIYKKDYQPGNGEAYLADGVQQSMFFGPILVDNGEAVQIYEKYMISTSDETREPRTAIGWAGGNHYIFIVADGRRDGWSEKGITLQELQQVFVEEGALVAYNLD
ncbi:MAG: phosphodiester glycosidase family protein, partial [Clostridia bacterium]|nr:phosphodiester glycosidase family protein [Clostridia bacterium]